MKNIRKTKILYDTALSYYDFVRKLRCSVNWYGMLYYIEIIKQWIARFL